ncbi:sigma-54-dependent transcriptional regulator [Pseudotabrizicola formosa]|uniref:sigma-54-dependent transcriptional regulator n=1 Tax=Pseudotabrizicola formosa TaxID=2030009 RepID=UPI000CD1E026|nr:sigma-54 dependent transcriptional regulator [Pseudotabrizicola formosa]
MTPGPVPLLLLTDVPEVQMACRSVLRPAGYALRTTGTVAEALVLFRETGALTVLLDLELEGGAGLALLRDLLALRPEAQVIAFTATPSLPHTVEAMRAGAQDVLAHNPFDTARLLAAVQRAITARPDPAPISPTPKTSPGVGAIPAAAAADTLLIGSSAAMQKVKAMIRSVAGSMATVFITGESGTGKELCALAVHAGSPRATGPFITLNCGAIPQDLLDTDVFGHRKGSVTGTLSDTPGAAVAADGGTLFLDEICELAPALQPRLLSFLQTSLVQPPGAVQPRKVDVRIICATNRDPAEAVRRGALREDLYYRLFVVPIHMPPLRARGDDVVDIAQTMLDRFAREEGRQFDGFAPDVLALFRGHSWPGNVRQLLNVIRSVVVLNPGGRITLDMLPASLQREGRAPPPVMPGADGEGDAFTGLIGRSMAEIERLVIRETIARSDGSVPRAARVLDLSPSTLYRKLEGWGDRP